MPQLSDFEKQRLERIERNNVVMEGMGIPGLVPLELRARASSGTAARRRKRAAPPAEDDTRERRRSSRLANAPAVVFTMFEEDEDLGDSREKRSKRATARPATADDGEVRTACARGIAPRGLLCSRAHLACSSQTAALSVAPSQAAAPPEGLSSEGVSGGAAAAGSSKALHARVADMAAWLGKQVLPTDGSGSYKLAAMSRLKGGGAVRFNKYSGIQEWQNAVRAVRHARRESRARLTQLLPRLRCSSTFAASPAPTPTSFCRAASR
jgi:hypothetical protein